MTSALYLYISNLVFDIMQKPLVKIKAEIKWQQNKALKVLVC